MNIMDKYKKLNQEIHLLDKHFHIQDLRLNLAKQEFIEAWADGNVPTSRLQECVDVLEARMEDVCIANRITEEEMDELVALTSHPCDNDCI